MVEAGPTSGGLELTVGSSVRLVDGAGSTWEPTGKAAVVLAMVGLEGPVPRRRLAQLLWPESGEAQSRNNLRTLVHRLNQRLGGELLAGVEQLELRCPVRTQGQDAQAVLKALQAGGALSCELLSAAGVDEEAGEELQAWLAQARLRVRRQQIAALCEALTRALARDQYRQAVPLAQACVQLEPLSEPWHRQLMDVLTRSGDRAGALTAYEACKAGLGKELGVLPDLVTRTMQLRILQEQALGVPDPVGAPEAPGLTPLGGAARYPLVEREALLQQVQTALEAGEHVVLLGEAGVGKTRLLRQLATMADDIVQVAFHDGLKLAPYSALTQLLQEVQPQRCAVLGRPEQMELARLAPQVFAGVQPSQASLSPPRLQAALRDWIRALVGAGVRVLVLDDLHHADAASQAALGAVLAATEDGLADRGPTMLLAHRSAEIEPALEEALLAAQVARRLRRVEVPRLSRDGLEKLLQAMGADRYQTEALVNRLLQRTGGNPLFAIEMARHALNQGETLNEASLQALLQARLQRCSMPAQQLAAVAAVAGADFTVELAEAATGQQALALMPGWAELQQRGLFADHGLAHDLVCDAVLAATPRAIQTLLHRKVAQHLEQQGRRGSAVLRHWRVTGDADHALPHVAYQVLVEQGTLELPAALQVELLDLLERAGDAALLKNLWVTVEFQERHFGRGLSDRLEALAHRVAPLAVDAETKGWVALNLSMALYLRGEPSRAYRELLPAAQRMAAGGVERAHMELSLGWFSSQLGLDAKPHLQAVQRIWAELPDRPEYRRSRWQARLLASVILDPAAAMRAERRQWRKARQLRDAGALAEVRLRMAHMQAAKHRSAAASRHLDWLARQQSTAWAGRLDDYEHYVRGLIALGPGRFSTALSHFDAVRSPSVGALCHSLLAILWLQLGRRSVAAECIGRLDLQPLAVHFPRFYRATWLMSALARDIGDDPLQVWQKALDIAGAHGVVGTKDRLLRWHVARRTLPAQERTAAGLALIEEMRGSESLRSYLAEVQIDVAEASAEQDTEVRSALAMAAARMVRRRWLPDYLYAPEAMVRCATLLQGSDAAEAESLRHVARRWVVQSLPYVPADALHGFVYEVPVNRELLGTDAEAAAAGILR